MLQSIPNVPRESQNVCLVELFSTTDVVLSHIRRTDSRSASSNFSFKYAKNNNSTCLKNVSCIPKIWSQCLKVTQKCLMSGEFQTLCLARYVYKKVSWKSFIINLWKQRLVFAFFCFFFPVGSDLLVLANICLALRNVTILWQGKVAYNWHDACLHLLFWNVGRRRDDDDAFLHCCKRAWMTHFMRKICIWIMIFFQIKKRVWPCPKANLALFFPDNTLFENFSKCRIWILCY